jgi:hypothetical protein
MSASEVGPPSSASAMAMKELNRNAVCHPEAAVTRSMPGSHRTAAPRSAPAAVAPTATTTTAPAPAAARSASSVVRRRRTGKST